MARAYLCFQKEVVRGIALDTPHPVPLVNTPTQASLRTGDVFYGTVRDVFAHFCFVQLTPTLLGFLSFSQGEQQPHSGEKLWVQVDRLALDGHHEHKMPRVRRDIRLLYPYFFYEYPNSSTQPSSYPALRFSKNLDAATQKRLRQWIGAEQRLSALGGSLILRGVAREATAETFQTALDALRSAVTRLKTPIVSSGAALPGPDPTDLFLNAALRAGCTEFFLVQEAGAPWGAHILQKYCTTWAPHLIEEIHVSKESRDFFDDLWAEKTAALSPLANDGSLIIEKTAALTSIDVNGRPTYVPAFNLLAAKACAARIVELNLSGVILIDFIDLATQNAQDKKAVLATLEEALQHDPERAHVLGLTPSGLVELSRRCTGPSLLAIS